MNPTQPQPSTAAQPIKPFGTDPKRSPLPMVVWTVLYIVWFAVLLWMVFYHTRPV